MTSYTNYAHAPCHSLGSTGAYIVTAGTYNKAHFFRSADRLALLHNALLKSAESYGCKLEAWAVFSNHYHFVGRFSENAKQLPQMLRSLHAYTAGVANVMDGLTDRRVWYQYWDKHLSYQASYLARLKYVMNNPVRHGLVESAKEYPWCSACYFEQRASKQFKQAVERIKLDQVKVFDEF